MKKSFTILELILVVLILSILYMAFVPKTNINNLHELKEKLTLQIKHLRYKALTDSKYSYEENWQKQNWTIKFFRCKEEVGGFYYVIYSDENRKGHPNQDESLKDPLTNKYIYTSNSCKENSENSKYTLLTKNFNIEKINISCNNTSSLGQLSFSYTGKVYSKLTTNINDQEKYEIKDTCTLEFLDKKNQKFNINIESNTGFIY